MIWKNQMRQYFAVIVQDSDMNFAVSFPDLPGCFATGTTFEEARVLAGEALARHLAEMKRNGAPIPSPSTLHTVVEGEDSRCGAAILIHEQAI
jgi:predicted RNase H-like HicB family nuclease